MVDTSANIVSLSSPEGIFVSILLISETNDLASSILSVRSKPDSGAKFRRLSKDTDKFCFPCRLCSNSDADKSPESPFLAYGSTRFSDRVQFRNDRQANVQLYTTDHFKILIDNLTRKMFELQIDGEENLTAEIIESRAKNIKSEIKISNLDKINVKLDEFHWAVFDACISIIKDGYEYTTLAILRRKLGGSANKKSITSKDENGNDKKISVDLKLDDDIKTALEELAMVRIAVNMEDTKKIYESPTQSGTYKFNGYILANESLEMKVNGQKATLYHFTSKSILFATSEMKDQVITSDQELFHPPIRMTRRSIAITHFLLRRIRACW